MIKAEKCKKISLIRKKRFTEIMFIIMAVLCTQPAFSNDHTIVTYFDYILDGGTIS